MSGSRHYYELTNGEETVTGTIWATEAEMAGIDDEVTRLVPHLGFTFMDDEPEVDLVVSTPITAEMVAHDLLLTSGFLPPGIDLDDFDKVAVHYHEGSHIAHPGIYCPACED